MEKENVFTIFFRYLILLILGMLIYSAPVLKALAILTIYPSSFFLSIFYKSLVHGSNILINSTSIEINSACVAISAYFLLLVINLTTPMEIKKRFKAILFSFALFLILNILRIFIFSILFINNYAYFDLAHKIFWYGLSTIIVVAIWFLTVYIFKIKSIPIYSDIRNMLKSISK